jgi:serine protease Do
VVAMVKRGVAIEQLTLTLPAGWRRAGDLSWRASSWGLRRMATGGLLLEELTADERAKAGAAEGGLALRVKHVGEYGAHAAAKKAGFRKGDILIDFDGQADLKRETDLLRYGVTNRKPGARVPVTVLRNAEKLTLTLPMQE